jgi:hypothetical protein
LAEDFVEVWSECKVKSLIVVEFGGEGECQENTNTLLPMPDTMTMTKDEEKVIKTPSDTLAAIREVWEPETVARNLRLIGRGNGCRRRWFGRGRLKNSTERQRGCKSVKMRRIILN